MRRHVLRIWTLCWLVLVWILLWGTLSAANILSGLAVALLITVLLPLPLVPVEGRVHPLSLLRLLVVVAYELVLSSLQVAWLAIRPGPPPRSAVLRARLAIKSDLVLALAVNIITLIPGSMVLEIDQERRLIYVHHRRRLREGRHPLLPPDRTDGAAAGGDVQRDPTASLP